MLEINKIHNIDCLEGLKLLDDNSVDSIVTDPPYELGFMGKKWDSTGIAYSVELWQEALRVLKHGGHLLAFGGTRTYHRMVCAIEDAGFEIRDCIQWIYGSGFPKSMDISKAIDKQAGAEREVIGRNQYVKRRPQKEYNHEQKWGKTLGGSESTLLTAPATEEAKQWEGWGTCLKPANEPIVVARKPLSEKTVASNVLKWGVGGINIDSCRVGNEIRENPQAGFIRRGRTDEEVFLGTDKNRPEGTVMVQGRFPANVIFDEEAGKMLDEQSGNLKSGGTRPNGINKSERSWKNTSKEIIANNYIPPSEGGASRFFYCAKASRSERGEGNNHPTVKPLKLIKYLITLITPPSGICLDPFEGSGTHAVACKELKYNYIGFEINKEYCEIAENRIKELK